MLVIRIGHVEFFVEKLEIATEIIQSLGKLKQLDRKKINDKYEYVIEENPSEITLKITNEVIYNHDKS